MTELLDSIQTRRAVIRTAAMVAGSAAVAACTSKGAPRVATITPAPAMPVPTLAQPVFAAAKPKPRAPAGVRPELFQRALAALDRHSMRVGSHDKIAIADFSIFSSRPRFHLVNLGTGDVLSLLVAHGSGSDPDHTGFLHRFSNDMGSNATCEGAFLTSDYYVGKHGSSQRLIGLDPTNDNALDRAIVVHAAAYANSDMIERFGKLGRSQGCFAVGEQMLEQVFLRLGQGRMIYAAKA